jgi:hypothetical protein
MMNMEAENGSANPKERRIRSIGQMANNQIKNEVKTRANISAGFEDIRTPSRKEPST